MRTEYRFLLICLGCLAAVVVIVNAIALGAQ